MGHGSRHEEAQRIHGDEYLGHRHQGGLHIGRQRAINCEKSVRGLLSAGSEEGAAS
jgi:hypothetical protein